jgi:hypothetical protein
MFAWKRLARALGRRPSGAPVAAPPRQCGSCRHFRNDPLYLEGAIPGLTSLSSGSASVRANDGLCLMHGRFVGDRFSCREHEEQEG